MKDSAKVKDSGKVKDLGKAALEEDVARHLFYLLATQPEIQQALRSIRSP